MGRILYRLIAVAAALVLALLVARHPLGPAMVVVPIAVYAAILARYPSAWLLVVPACLPVIDLTMWTGSLLVQESDLLILTTVAVGYWHLGTAAPRFTLGVGRGAVVLLLAASYLASAALPLGELSVLTWPELETYNSPWNAVRVLKGFVLAVLLLPLLRTAASDDGIAGGSLLLSGMLLGLLAVSLTVLWERNAFPGILNFSADYRATGPFWEAHVGGAALDGYLALTIPFALAVVAADRRRWLLVLATVALALGTYAAAASFSRGLYAAYAIGAVLIAGVLTRRALLDKSLSSMQVVVMAIAFVIGAVLLTRVFSTGGYRALAAAIGTVVCGLYFGALRDRDVGALGPAAWLGAIALLLTGFFLLAVPKGAYWVYALSGGLFAALLALHLRQGAPRVKWIGLVFLWLGLNTLAVAWHWGGVAALIDAALAMTACVVVVFFNRSAALPIWGLSWGAARASALGVLIMALAIPVLGNYYMQQRFSDVETDLRTRLQHWQRVLDIMPKDAVAQAFGAGLGQFPDMYFWRNSEGEVPGVLTVVAEAAERYVRLGGPRYPTGYGETIRLFQRVAVVPNEALSFSVDLRTPTPKAQIKVAVCEKWLLYYGHWPCSTAVELSLSPGSWTTYARTLDTGDVGRSHWWGQRPAQLLLFVERAGTVVDVDNVRLRRADGSELIINGDFGNGGERWFFSSDRHHLPWHAKNIWLQVWFEQGWFGVVAFSLFLVVAISAVRWHNRRAVSRLALGASLVGFAIVGVFDSLLNNTRVAVVFYLVCMVALLRPAPVRLRMRRSVSDLASNMPRGSRAERSVPA